VVAPTTDVSLVTVLGFLLFSVDLLKLQRKMHFSENWRESSIRFRSQKYYMLLLDRITCYTLNIIAGLHLKKQPAMDASVTLPGDIEFEGDLDFQF
jgi:hypothetical protein